MDEIKIIFFDIDGTLIDLKTKCMTERTKETLLRLRENGVKICIATGRSPITLPKFEGIEFDAYITYNGSYCFSENNVIFSNPIPSEEVRKIIYNAKEIGRLVSLATKKRLVANGVDKNLSDYYSFARLDIDVAEDFEKVAGEEIYQVMSGCCEAEYEAIMKDVQGARITAWWDRAVDIIPANGGKGLGIQRILEYFQIDYAESMAFGDGNNDIEMLQAVGNGVAMGNASQQLKEIADDVCGTVAEDGIYHYCVKKGII